MTQQNALAVREPNNQIANGNRSTQIDVFKLADAFASSGLFQDAKDASKALVKILFGQEIGIQPASSMSSIHVINGKPVIGANAPTSRLVGRFETVELSHEKCVLHFFKPRYTYDPENPATYNVETFTIKDAERAGLTKKEVWKSFPKNMLFARAISNGARFYCADVFGGASVYTPEELGAQVDADGELVHDPTDDRGAGASVFVDKTPNKTQALANIPNMPRTDQPKASESVLKIRAQIKDLLQSIGVDPTNALGKYDKFKTDDQRRDALEKVQKLVDEQKKTLDQKQEPIAETETFFDPERAAKIGIIKDGLAQQPWSLAEVEKYLDGFGIAAIDDASDETVDAILADMRESRMIV